MWKLQLKLSMLLLLIMLAFILLIMLLKDTYISIKRSYKNYRSKDNRITK